MSKHWTEERAAFGGLLRLLHVVITPYTTLVTSPSHLVNRQTSRYSEPAWVIVQSDMLVSWFALPLLPPKAGGEKLTTPPCPDSARSARVVSLVW